MAINFGPIVAGAYSGTYNSVDVGFTLNGWRYGVEWLGEILNQSDIFGDTIFDIIYRGGNAQLSFVSKTFKAGSLTPFWPWSGGVSGVPFSQIYSDSLPIGRSARATAAAMVLTVVANTPADLATALTPASIALDTLTAAKAILAPNFRGELLFDSRSRDVPCQLQLLPYEHSTTGSLIHASIA